MLFSSNIRLNSVEEVNQANDQIAHCLNQGCVIGWYCKNCFHLIQDTLCMCIGNFTCPVCQYKNVRLPINNFVFDGLHSLNLVREESFAFKESRDW